MLSALVLRRDTIILKKQTWRQLPSQLSIENGSAQWAHALKSLPAQLRRAGPLLVAPANVFFTYSLLKQNVVYMFGCL